VNSTHIYEYGFDKYHISETTGIDRAQLSEVARKIVDYFSSRTETPQMTVENKKGEQFKLFHEHELIHLQDVKGLFRLNHRAQMASLAYITIFSLLFLLWAKGRWQDLAKGLKRGCALTLLLIAAASIASVFDFEQLFIQFHLIYFHNPYWLLDPSKDYLIKLFPPPFWERIAILGGIAIAAEALILGAVAWAVPSIYKKHHPAYLL